MANPWWDEEPPVTTRRQGLPHTEPKLPSSGDIWKIVRHMVLTFTFPLSWQAGMLMILCSGAHPAVLSGPTKD